MERVEYPSNVGTIPSKVAFCEEKVRLMEEFMAAATELVMAHNEQVEALLADDPDFNRFDLVIHLASERKRRAKYEYIIHCEKHGC